MHMFWAYGPFSQMETLCATSFVKLGYQLIIWTYGDLPNAPQGAEVRHAGEILPESGIFTYSNGSYAAYANLFRYAVLTARGGLYVDTDVIALRPLQELPQAPFLVAQRQDHELSPWRRKLTRLLTGTAPVMLNPNVIYNPSPKPGDVVDLALAVALRYPTDQLAWADTGPRLLSVLHDTYTKLSFQVMPPEFANPVDWWECPGQLLTPGHQLPEGSAFLHCFNEMWRRAGIDKNAPFPAGSIMASMADRFL